MIWWLWHFVKTFYLKISEMIYYNTIWHHIIWYEEVYNIYHKNIYYKLGLGLYCTYYIICFTISGMFVIQPCEDDLLSTMKLKSRRKKIIFALAETHEIVSHLIPFYRTNVFHFGRTAVFKHNSSNFNPLNFQGTYQSMLWIINLKTKI